MFVSLSWNNTERMGEMVGEMVEAVGRYNNYKYAQSPNYLKLLQKGGLIFARVRYM